MFEDPEPSIVEDPLNSMMREAIDVGLENLEILQSCPLADRAASVQSSTPEIGCGAAHHCVTPTCEVGVGRRGEAHHEDAGIGVPEPRDGETPVGLLAEASDLHQGLGLAPLDEARARVTIHDRRFE